jgi:alkylated DNA repair dioxygenase AlkB
MTIHPAAAETDWSLHEGWLKPELARHWQTQLEHQLKWEQPVVQVYGKRHPVPRLTVFLANEGIHYRYSGAIHTGDGWPAWFKPLLHQVNEACETNFNGCLLNWYRHGDDRMGWHADDEPEIDQRAPIASLSLGATRDFQLRHRKTAHLKMSLPLADGDLLVMHPGCQSRWMHSVPQRRKVQSTRINLTFRRFQN